MCSKKLVMKCKPTCGRWRVAGGSSPARSTETAESIHLVCTSSSISTRWWQTLVDIWERRERQWGFRVYKQNHNREGKVAVSDVIQSDSSLVLSQRCVFSHRIRVSDSPFEVRMNEVLMLHNMMTFYTILCFGSLEKVFIGSSMSTPLCTRQAHIHVV